MLIGKLCQCSFQIFILFIVGLPDFLYQ
jgi:hypothetical protein